MVPAASNLTGRPTVAKPEMAMAVPLATNASASRGTAASSTADSARLSPALTASTCSHGSRRAD